MSQGNSSSFGKEVISASQKLGCPIGQNLQDSTLRTLAPSMGAIAYGSDDNLLYYGSIDMWNVAGMTGNTGQQGSTGQRGSTGSTGQPGLTSVGPFSQTSTANAATISSQTLTLYSANATNPGCVNTTGQSFSGVKTFNDGIIVQPSVSVGINNVLTLYCQGGLAPATWSGGFSVVVANLATILLDRVVTFMPGDSLASSGSNAIATLSPALQPEFWPSTVGRGGGICVMDNGVYKTGYFFVSTSGVVTVGIGRDSSGNLLPFTGGAGQTGIVDCAVMYTTF
jgi:hypothetical protein